MDTCVEKHRQNSQPTWEESRGLGKVVEKGASPNLDLLRSVAVLFVLADHIAGTFGIAQKHPKFWFLGLWGVLLFFIHTSLVLMMSMERLDLSGWRLHSIFYVRRFFRIYPLSVAVILVVVAAHIPPITWRDDDIGTITVRSIITNLLLCQNLFREPPVIGPLWSLPYEVQMYLVLPALFLLVRKCRSGTLAGLWYGAAAIGLLQPWLAATHHGRLWGLDRFDFAQYVPCFLAGVIAYYLLCRRKKAELPFWVWVATLFAISWVYVKWTFGADQEGFPAWLCCLAVGLVVVYCAESPFRLLNFMTHHIAKYSYGLYLGQIPVLWFAFFKLKALPLALQWVVFVVLIVGVPIASYHLIEEPFMKLGRAITKVKKSPRKAVARIEREDDAVTESLVAQNSD
jgi:peptidoglycan/LPS O-acetylase OafA/YrhL